MKLTRLNELIEENEVVKGRWELDRNHEVQYKSRGRTEKAEEVKLKASLLAAEPGALVLSVTERQSDHTLVTSLLKLTGAWHLDAKNRIVFAIEKEFGKKDILTFEGRWQVGKSHEIIYTYEKKSLTRRTKETNTLVFKGTWDISARNRLTFSLGADSESSFQFRGALQTKSLFAKDGEIRYQIGVETRGKRRIQTVVLFGEWKLSKDLELSFEIEYEDGRKKAITFGGEFAIGKDSHLRIQLKTGGGKSLGMEVIFTKDFLEDRGGAFLRLRKSLEESAVEAGVKLTW